jgi:glycerol-3-phosphate dehydrogenase
VETIHKEDYTTTAYNISGIFSSHARTIPALSEKQVITYFSGIRAATYEEDFIICKGKYIANIVHAAGIQSPGLTAAPAIGFEVAHMVVELFGGENYVHLNPDFDPIRIAPPHPATMDVAALDELIKTNPDYGIIICRCENITKGEILNALRRNVRCDTLDSVKRRVRPGMGRCQGGFCSPLILDIISSEKRTTPHNISKGGSGSELLFGSTKTTFEKKTTTSDKAPVRKSSADSKAERILRARADSMRGVIKTIREDDDDYDV